VIQASLQHKPSSNITKLTYTNFLYLTKKLNKKNKSVIHTADLKIHSTHKRGAIYTGSTPQAHIWAYGQYAATPQAFLVDVEMATSPGHKRTDVAILEHAQTL